MSAVNAVGIPDPGPPGPEVLEVLEVRDPGFLTTVQDGGRPGLEALGITPGGPADPWSLGVANALVGNPPGEAGLEITLAGPVLHVLRRMSVALAGADLGAHVVETGEEVPGGASVTLAAGTTLAFGGTGRPAYRPGPGARPTRGARAYLAIPGGFDVPVVLGSRATALGAGFGGVEGRPLRTGDRLRATPAAGLVRGAARWPGLPVPEPDPVTGAIRILPGPHAGRVGGNVVEAFAAGAWTVSPASDRVGLRLDGAPLPGDPTGELASHGVVTGCVQLPPDGRPIVLLPDRQPTGGYPVIAVVVAADRPLLGQLAPGDTVRFAIVDAATALLAARRSRDAFAGALAHLGDTDLDGRWDDLWRHAGA